MAFLKEKIEIKLEEAELNTKRAFDEFAPKIKRAIVILLIAIIPAYFLSRIITEKVWLKRHQQTNFVAKASFTNPLAPTFSELTVKPQGDGNYTAWIKITNPNLELSVDNASYHFNFYNQEKQQIYTYPDKIPDALFLLPNQTKYISVPRFTTNEPIAYSDFQIQQDLAWQKRLALPKVDFITSPVNTYQQSQPPGFVAEGDFVNNSPYNLKKVRLTFILTNSKNEIIDITQRDESSVSPFGRRAYKQLWPNLLAGDIFVKPSADTDMLNPNNYTITTDVGGNGSGLDRPETE